MMHSRAIQAWHFTNLPVGRRASGDVNRLQQGVDIAGAAGIDVACGEVSHQHER